MMTGFAEAASAALTSQRHQEEAARRTATREHASKCLALIQGACRRLGLLEPELWTELSHVGDPSPSTRYYWEQPVDGHDGVSVHLSTHGKSYGADKDPVDAELRFPWDLGPMIGYATNDGTDRRVVGFKTLVEAGRLLERIEAHR